MMNDLIITIMKLLARAFSDKPKLRPFFLLFPVCLIVGSIFGILGVLKVIGPDAVNVGVAISSITAGIVVVIIASYQSVSEDKAKQERIYQIQKEVRQNPEKTRAAWDLAQEKLESYLDRNLSQVRSVYWLCVFVMLFGFGLVVYGAILVYRSPENLSPSVLSSISGVMISFLGGSFIFIYKSTLSQAKDYVSMLERINAVGMSLQILDSLEDKDQLLKSKSKAELARELLKIYSKE